MSSYLPYDHKASRFLRLELFTMALCLILVILAHIFIFPGSSFTILGGILFFYFLLRIVRVEKVKAVVFDEQSRVVRVHFTKFGRLQSEVLPFDEIEIEVEMNKSALLFSEPLIVYFLKRGVEQFELNKTKDGFACETLEQIVSKSQTLSLRVVEKAG